MLGKAVFVLGLASALQEVSGVSLQSPMLRPELCHFADVNMKLEPRIFGRGANMQVYKMEFHTVGTRIIKSTPHNKDEEQWPSIRKLMLSEYNEWVALTGGKDIEGIAGFDAMCEDFEPPIQGPVLVQQYGGVLSLKSLIGGHYDEYLTDDMRLQLAVNSAKIVKFLQHDCPMGKILWKDMSPKHMMVDDDLNVRLVDVNLMSIDETSTATGFSGAYVDNIPETNVRAYSNIHQLCTLIYLITTPLKERTINVGKHGVITEDTVDGYMPDHEYAPIFRTCWARDIDERGTAEDVLDLLNMLRDVVGESDEEREVSRQTRQTLTQEVADHKRHYVKDNSGEDMFKPKSALEKYLEIVEKRMRKEGKWDKEKAEYNRQFLKQKTEEKERRARKQEEAREAALQAAREEEERKAAEEAEKKKSNSAMGNWFKEHQQEYYQMNNYEKYLLRVKMQAEEKELQKAQKLAQS